MARQMGFELWVLPPRATLSRVRSESDFAIEQTTAFCAFLPNHTGMAASDLRLGENADVTSHSYRLGRIPGAFACV
jgi:hypothetical protein